jgi:catechol 2,3-dioxygenase-like lactoylglutathione lyase family enzyme
MASPPLRATLITLGVADVRRAARFYETLGMRRCVKGAKDVAFFEAGGVALAVWGRADLAKDAGLQNSKPGFSGVALAFNVADEPSVDAALQAAGTGGWKDCEGGRTRLLGRLYGLFRRPRRAPLGGRA